MVSHYFDDTRLNGDDDNYDVVCLSCCSSAVDHSSHFSLYSPIWLLGWCYHRSRTCGFSCRLDVTSSRIYRRSKRFEIKNKTKLNSRVI